MPIAISEEHRELSASLRDWAASLSDPVWADVVKQGIPLIGVPEDAGGDGGTLADLAVALEACAWAMLPGPLLGTAGAASLVGHSGARELVGEIAAGAKFGIALDPSVAYDGADAEWVLAAAGDQWYAAPAGLLDLAPGPGPDLGRMAARVGRAVDPSDERVVALPGVSTDLVRRTLLTLAAAEAAGVASWCLTTAVDYAKVREQFGQPIGRFQAVKQLCAVMAETVEAVTAAAWDASQSSADAPSQWAFAVDVTGAVALDGAVRVAQDCIQVLGGIGFTYEHAAHRYLRRAVALRSLLGGGDRHAVALARRAVAGERRRLKVSLEGADGGFRESARETAASIAAAADRRAALVDTGYLVPHWPPPYGLGASPVEQLVIDEELAAAGVERPDLKIGAWAAPTILRHGTDAQRERFVGPTLRGEIVWCQLFSEPGAGSDLASLRTRAVRVDGGWRITGQKVWTSMAMQADWAICLARTNPDEPRHRGITYFLLDMRTPGIEVRPLREMTGDALFNEVFLDDVLVPDDCVVGEVDGGWPLARTTLSNERVAMASARLGASVERAIELVGADSTELDLAQVGHQVALATVCAQLGVRSVLKTLAGAGPGAESGVAKLLGVRSRQEASELVVELLGPAALLVADSEEDVHEMLLTRCLSIAGGTTQILRNVVAEQILGLPR